MGKKAKKKAKSSNKDKNLSSKSTSTDATNTDTVVVVKDSRICPHLAKGIDLDLLKAKFESSVSLKCEDCRDDVKGRQSKKKGGGNVKSESKSIWVCLSCGHYSCAGDGLPTTPRSHAILHSKKNHHQLTVQIENPQVLWCFACSTLVHPEKSEDFAEKNDVLHKIAKMIKERPTKKPALDVVEIWFGSGSGSGSVLDGVTRESCPAVNSDGKSRVVRGMLNLGNTCFFNSVMQSLLALEQLRCYFLELDVSPGPLTSSLKKLVVEICEDSGPRSAINPKAFFGSVCSKAPQFRGYQQQDSHEFLRCLLDGLSTEELSAKKKIESTQEDVKSEPTFVEAVFGGQLCSTVTCIECGHSSVVHEPFLDLSLPLPSKKPPSKKAQPLAGTRKPKLPPRNKGRNRPKLSRDTSAPPSCRSADRSLRANVSISNAENSEPKHCVENNIKEQPLPEDFAWWDYIDDDTISSTNPVDSETPDLPLNHEHAAEKSGQNEMVVHVHDSTECSGLKNEVCTDKAKSLDKLTSMDDAIGERLPDFHDLTSLVNEKLVIGDPSEDSAKDKNNTSTEQALDAVKPSDSSSKEASPLIFEDSAILLLIEGEISKDSAKDKNNTSTEEALDAVKPSDSSSKEATPLIYEDSDILLLIEDEVSKPSLGYEQDSVEFDGLGGLFDEPEDAVTSSMNSLAVSNPFEAIKTVETVSESEPDEVDNSDAPISVEKCLSFFIKSERLTKKEHAWQCENCTKQERRRLRKKSRNSSSLSLLNRNEDRQKASSGQSGFYKSVVVSNGVNNLCNGNINMESPNNIDGDCILKTSEQNDMDLGATQCEETKGDLDVVPDSFSRDENTEQVNGDYKRGEDLNVDKPDAIQGGDSFSASGESEISEDEKIDTETVKVERDATKKILIDKAPRVLTIHLKRFGHDARGRLNKLNGHVQFNTTIDLKPYIDSRCTEKDECKYRLVGVVEHMGSMRGGHYIAYVRGGKSIKKSMESNADDNDYVWYNANDSYVSESSLEEVLRSDAYILFYEQV